MDASASGSPWYPSECIVVRVWWPLDAGHRAVFGLRRNCFIRDSRSGVSGDVGWSHVSVGSKIESPLVKR